MVKRFLFIIFLFLGAITVNLCPQQQPQTKYTQPPQCTHCTARASSAHAPANENEADTQNEQTPAERAAKKENLRKYTEQREQEKAESHLLNDME